MSTSKKKDRKTTIFGVLINMTEQMKQEVNQCMFDYSFMFRFSFKRLAEIEREHEFDEDRKKAIQQLEKDVSSRTGYPIRVAKDAVADANELLTARHTLMVEYHELWKERYKNTKAKYEKFKQNPNVNHRSFHMLGLQNKMERQLKQMQFYKQHILQHTFPSIVFGGRKNFEELQKGNLSKEKWNELRNGRMSSRGDATKGGNPNLRVIETEGGFALQMISNRKVINGKKFYYEKTLIPLYIATKRSKKTRKLNGRKYPEVMKRALESGKAYQVEILKRDGQYHVRITVSEEKPIVQEKIHGYLAVDTNIDGLALCFMNTKGFPIKFTWLGEGGLQYYPTHKRENIIWELAHQVVWPCVKQKLALVLEDLTFIHSKDVSKKVRRTSHQFCYRKLLECMTAVCVRYGVKQIQVKPQFTSVIGRLKYQTRFRVNVHSAAALVIGRRAIPGLRETVPKKLLCLLTEKQLETFHEQNEWKQWSTLQKQATKLLKKQGVAFYQWHDYKKRVYQALVTPKVRKTKSSNKKRETKASFDTIIVHPIAE
ncbi:IS200/IS605 family accessory protein TnpB-related protein [Ectobacillus funiculus]|uniref:IS200/IS605 family accessory protein TnpB-related protein n=1 Tax=Ectobacillus funiculus TaxID=137993 RepID=A0ABV5WPA2_9BACI